VVAFPQAQSRPSKSELCDPAPLWVGGHACESGYRGIYRHHRGGWHGKVKLGGRLRCVPGTRRPTPRDAARALAAWYAARYGPAWPDVVRQRTKTPWHTWYSPRRGGWLLRVWEWGQPVEVVELTRRGRPTARVRVFPTGSAAVAYARVWFRLRWGLFHRLAAWRG
jgi:hypothetical protein